MCNIQHSVCKQTLLLLLTKYVFKTLNRFIKNGLNQSVVLYSSIANVSQTGSDNAGSLKGSSKMLIWFTWPFYRTFSNISSWKCEECCLHVTVNMLNFCPVTAPSVAAQQGQGDTKTGSASLSDVYSPHHELQCPSNTRHKARRG